MNIGETAVAEATDSPSIGTAIGLTTAITAVSYGVTLLQQVLYARALGVNAETDALAAALAWAVGTTGLVGTTLSTVFLPRYVRAVEARTGGADLRARATLIALLVGLALMLATYAAAPLLAEVLVPAGGDERRGTLVALLRIVSPLELTWPLVWLAVSIANARERYVLAAASAILPPLPIVGLLVTGSATVELVAIAYLAGTVLQLIALWVFEPESRLVVRPGGTPATIAIVRDLVPVGLAFALFSAIPLEVRGLASLHGVGAVAIADYASRLVLAGQQVLLSGLLAVTFTRWSGRSAAGRPAAALDSVDRTVLWVAIGGVATALVLPLVAVDLTRIVFSGGRFSQADAVDVGTFVGWMAPGVAGHMILMVSVRALLAEGRVGPMIVAAIGAAASVLLVGMATQSIWGLSGVAAGYSAGYLVSAMIAYVAIRTGRLGARRRRSVKEPAFPVQSRDAPLLAVYEDSR